MGSGKDLGGCMKTVRKTREQSVLLVQGAIVLVIALGVMLSLSGCATPSMFGMKLGEDTPKIKK